jgi:hypothetical protein
VAVAMERMRLIDELQRSRDELEMRVQDGRPSLRGATGSFRISLPLPHTTSRNPFGRFRPSGTCWSKSTATVWTTRDGITWRV